MSAEPAPQRATLLSQKARFPIRWKLVLLTTFLSIVPLSAVGVGLIEANRDAVKNLSREAQLLALDDLARTIDLEFHEAEDALEMVAALFADPSLGDEQRITLIRSQVQGLESIDHVALYDSEGQQILIVEESEATPMELPEILPEAIRDQVEDQHAGAGDVENQNGELRTLVAVRIHVQDRTTGYVASLVSLEDVQLRVERLAEGHFADIDGSLFVVDQRLRSVAHTNREQAMALADCSGEGILQGLTPDQLGPSYMQSGEFTAQDGTEMLGTSVGMTTQPWVLVAQVPQSIAYASLHRMQYVVIGTIVLVMLLALVLGWFVARRISAPLHQLSQFAKALASRQFDERVNVGTSDELAILGAAMNGAAADLRASEDRIREEVAIRTDLGRYIPGELVDQIVRRERDMGLGGSRRQITVMFADVVGFTPLTEQLEPEHVVTILNELFTILTQIVFRHGGTVDKFVGDCVMAIWGAPTAQDDHASRALSAAEDMLSWLETGNERWEETFGVTIQLAIGVHTGEAIVGNIGSETRMEYTAIGDVVNVAARLEAIARPQQILVTEAVKEAAGDDFEYLDADLHRLSGRSEPVHLFEVRA